MKQSKPFPSTLPFMVSVLLVIALVIGGLLVLVNSLTRDSIARVELDRKTAAIARVLADFDNEILATRTGGKIDGTLDVYSAMKDGVPAGWAVETWSDSGYGGRIRIMTGFSPDGKLVKSLVLAHTETPGLGAKMVKPRFINQFAGLDLQMPPLKVRKDGGSIDAIAAATISSRAVCEAIEKARREVAAIIDSSDASPERKDGQEP